MIFISVQTLQDKNCFEHFELGYVPSFDEEVPIAFTNGTSIICSLGSLHMMSEACAYGYIGIKDVCYKLEFLNKNSYEAEE